MSATSSDAMLERLIASDAAVRQIPLSPNEYRAYWYFGVTQLAPHVGLDALPALQAGFLRSGR